MILKIKRFLKLDIRWKLIKISKKINLNLYPKKFKINGIYKFFTKIIFNLIFFEKILNLRKKILDNLLFYLKLNKKLNAIISPPSSGSNFVRNVFSSYFELRYKIGNGIPKINNYADNEFLFNDSPIIKGDFFNNINFSDIKKKIPNRFYDENDYINEIILMSRYPLQPLDMFSLDQLNPIILIRKPDDWFYSYYTHLKTVDNYYKNIDKKLILNFMTKRYYEFYFFWTNYIKKNKNYIIIEFEELTNNPENIFKNIINFFKINLDIEKINKAIMINSKEFTLKNLEVHFYGTRFTNQNSKNKIKIEIKDEVLQIIKDNNLEKLYNELKNAKI